MILLWNIYLMVVIVVSLLILRLRIARRSLVVANATARPVDVFFFEGFRWFCLAAVLILCTTRGAIATGSRVVAGVTLAIAIAVLDITASLLVNEETARNPARPVDWIILMSATVPLPIVCYSSWWLDFRPHSTAGFGWARWLAIACSAGIALIGVAIGTADDRFESQSGKDPDSCAHAPVRFSPRPSITRSNYDHVPGEIATWTEQAALNLYHASPGVHFWSGINRVAPEEWRTLQPGESDRRRTHEPSNLHDAQAAVRSFGER